MVSRAGQLSRQLARAECKGGRRRGAAHRNPQKGKNLNIPTSEPSKRYYITSHNHCTVLTVITVYPDPHIDQNIK